MNKCVHVHVLRCMTVQDEEIGLSVVQRAWQPRAISNTATNSDNGSNRNHDSPTAQNIIAHNLSINNEMATTT